MYRFKTSQKTFEIAGVKVGGQPGELPTVLVGSMFYSRHRIVTDEKKGIFDTDAAEALIQKQAELGEKTRNPALIDIISSSPEAVIRYIDFVAGITDRPFLIDSASPAVKIAAIDYAKETGLEKRIIYNSISVETKEDEFLALKRNGIEAGILLTYTKDLMRSRAREEMVEILAPKMEEAGITKILVDTFVMDVPCLTPSNKATLEIKSHTGLPCGTAAHNAISTWNGLKKMLGKEGVKAADLTASLMPVFSGADYILYGPVEGCEYVFPAVFTVNTSYRYAARMKETIEI
ncbi:tetrahydromethanopterin S-methyltransferase subunit H family protein [Methanogenium cariaci]|jgi:[methyl-Co(III) methoxylated-aromatic-compound-specific corrinoid protein]---tetrahydromethanopterin methyltransferase